MKKKTIKELQAEVKKIEKTQQTVDHELNLFLQKSGLHSMIRKDLSNMELIDFQQKIRYFLSFKKTQTDRLKMLSNVEKKQEIQTTIIAQKNVLYKSIINYIKPNAMKQYLEFIKTDIKLEKQKNTLEASKNETNQIIDKKVEVLQEKIQKHKQYLNKTLRKIVETKLDKKLEQLSKLESFKNLPNQKKVLVLEKTLSKISTKKRELEKKLESNTIYYEDTIRKKIEVYQIGEEKIKAMQKTFR